MRKFVIKIVVYAVLLATLTGVINYLYVWKDSKSNKFMNVPSGVQICNFGSSHGLYGFNYEDVEDRYTCFNFAMVSQTISYDQRILDVYKDRIAEGAVVFINVSYFTPYGIPETNNEDFESKNQRYYAFLPKDHIKDYAVKWEFLSGRFRSLNKGIFSVMRTILQPAKEPQYDSWWVESTNAAYVREDAVKAYHRHCVEGKVDAEGKLICNEEEINALHAMINTCREIGARPVLVTVPYLKEYTDLISEGSPGFFDDFYGWLNGVTEEEDVEYYDYSRDERFSGRYDLFMNADHLNKEGARQFTDILLKDAGLGAMVQRTEPETQSLHD